MTKYKSYLYGKSVMNSEFYVVYIGQDVSFDALKKVLLNIEGVFIPRLGLKNLEEVLCFKEDEKKSFCTKYNGTLIPFGNLEK